MRGTTTASFISLAMAAMLGGISEHQHVYNCALPNKVGCTTAAGLLAIRECYFY